MDHLFIAETLVFFIGQVCTNGRSGLLPYNLEIYTQSDFSLTGLLITSLLQNLRQSLWSEVVALAGGQDCQHAAHPTFPVWASLQERSPGMAFFSQQQFLYVCVWSLFLSCYYGWFFSYLWQQLSPSGIVQCIKVAIWGRKEWLWVEGCLFTHWNGRSRKEGLLLISCMMVNEMKEGDKVKNNPVWVWVLLNRPTCGWWTPRRISAVPLRREPPGWWPTTPPNWRHSWSRTLSIVSTTNSASPKAASPSPPHAATVTSPNKLSCGRGVLIIVRYIRVSTRTYCNSFGCWCISQHKSVKGLVEVGGPTRASFIFLSTLRWHRWKVQQHNGPVPCITRVVQTETLTLDAAGPDL